MDALLWVILAVTVLTALVTIASLFRSQQGHQNASQELRQELREGREEYHAVGKDLRKEVSDSLKSSTETMSKTLETIATVQQTQLANITTEFTNLTKSNQEGLERIQAVFASRIKELQTSNEQKLDDMRKTVDEKLHDTLEKRLGESFKLVNNQLEAVHKGLGEMQSLAAGVGDLKRVLTNVKARGTWAEVQLGALLEQVLTAEQYEKNACVQPGSQERVEYAIKLPGPNCDPRNPVWLPIDSKFPQEDYLRLQEAAERADPDAIQNAAKSLAQTVRNAAKDICEKYLHPPNTTDFGIMFLATEGLYAEVLRQSTLVEEIQQKYRVVIAGPTTLIAILSSLRLGFQTLAIEQRASEAWRILGAVKTEFGKFGGVLDKLKKQLDTASRTLAQTGVRSRAIEKQLVNVGKLPNEEATHVLALPDETAMIDAEDAADGELDNNDEDCD